MISPLCVLDRIGEMIEALEVIDAIKSSQGDRADNVGLQPADQHEVEMDRCLSIIMIITHVCVRGVCVYVCLCWSHS